MGPKDREVHDRDLGNLHLFQLKQINVEAYAKKLRATEVLEEWVDILSKLTEELITYNLMKAIRLI